MEQEQKLSDMADLTQQESLNVPVEKEDLTEKENVEKEMLPREGEKKMAQFWDGGAKTFDEALPDQIKIPVNREGEFPKKANDNDLKRGPTFGEKLIGVDFNPSKNPKIDRVKKICAELADIVHDCHYNGAYSSELIAIMYANTIGEIKNAAMNAVYVLILKEKS